MAFHLERRRRTVPALVAVGFLWGCGGPAPNVGRPVLSGVEDEETERVTCEVLGRRELVGDASVATPALARGAGWLAVAWVAREGGRRVVRVQRLTPQLDPLGAALDLDPSGDAPSDIGLSACGGGLALTWQVETPEGDSVRFATLSLDGPGPSELRAGVAAAPGAQPALGCAGSTAAIAWSLHDHGLRDVFVRWLGPDGALGDPLRVSGDTDAASDPAVACSTEACVVAWSDNLEVYPEVYAVVVEAGGPNAAPPAPVRISVHDQTRSGAGGAYAPGIGALGGEHFLVAWHDTRSGDESEVYAARLSARGGAGLARRISRSPASSVEAAAAACDEGAGVVAWRDRRGGPFAVVLAGVDGGGRRRSAAITLSGDADEASAPAAACAMSAAPPRPPVHAIAWTEASLEPAGGVLRTALVSCR